MSKIKFIFTVLSLCVCSFICSSNTFAQSSVVYVTANRGTDLNTCTRTSPCRSIAQGITTVAAGGTVVILDSGDYSPFTINKSVTVAAAPGVEAVIVATSGEGITVTTAATTDNVILRGLSVTGQAGTTNGIHVTAQLASLYIENCVVTGFNGGAPNAGIYINAAGEYFIKDTLVRNNNGVGIYFATASGTISGTVEHCRMENNGVNGLRVEDNSTVAVRDSVAAGNSGSGIFANTATADLSVENCLATRNSSNGVRAFNMSTVRVSNSTLVKNSLFGLINDGGTLQSSGNNILGGNGSGPTSGAITTVPIG
jgi:nitrous oxidase accessory protein NosD